MHHETLILILSALTVGFIHTLLGPDHYVPFIVMSKARQWSLTKTVVITTLCGIGHVLSAVILGLIAVSIGITLAKLNFIESVRGTMAAWLLIGFGFAYLLWGIRLAIKNKRHQHIEKLQHETFSPHVHHKKSFKELTPWILFLIFILGPCEPLIPLIMYPGIKGSIINVTLVTIFFGIATLCVMLLATITAVFGFKLFKFDFFERYGNALAGAVVCGSGLAIKFLGI
jgi:nickel/cobalt transporter (NicO) family protein